MACCSEMEIPLAGPRGASILALKKQRVRGDLNLIKHVIPGDYLLKSSGMKPQILEKSLRETNLFWKEVIECQRH